MTNPTNNLPSNHLNANNETSDVSTALSEQQSNTNGSPTATVKRLARQLPMAAPSAPQPLPSSAQQAPVDSNSNNQERPSKKVKTNHNTSQAELINQRSEFQDLLLKDATARLATDFLLSLNDLKTRQEGNNNQNPENTVIEALNDFYESRLNLSDSNHIKLNEFFNKLKVKVTEIQTQDSLQASPLEKANILLQLARRLIKPSINPEVDLLVNKGVFSPEPEYTLFTRTPPSESTKQVASVSSALLITAIEQALSQVDWTASTLTPMMKSNILEQLVNLKTAVGKSAGVLENDAQELLAAANELYTPSIPEHQQTLAALQNQQQQLMVAMRQVPVTQQQQLLADFRNQFRATPAIDVKNYIHKMRSYIAAANALSQFGSTAQKEKVSQLINEIKILHANGTKVNEQENNPFNRFLKQDSIHKLEELLAKALCVEIMTGQPEQAFNHIFSRENNPIQNAETLLKLVTVSRENTFKPKETLTSEQHHKRNLFKPVLAKAYHEVLNDEALPQDQKNTIYRELQDAMLNFGLHNDANRVKAQELIR